MFKKKDDKKNTLENLNLELYEIKEVYGFFDDVGSAISGATGGAGDAITGGADQAGKIIDAIKDHVTSAFDDIIKFFTDIWDWIVFGAIIALVLLIIIAVPGVKEIIIYSVRFVLKSVWSAISGIFKGNRECSLGVVAPVKRTKPSLTRIGDSPNLKLDLGGKMMKKGYGSQEYQGLKGKKHDLKAQRRKSPGEKIKALDKEIIEVEKQIQELKNSRNNK
jgi:hypothetical protein